MEAKDTVMSPEEIEAIPLGVQDEHHRPTVGFCWKGNSELFEVITQKQAEISFKAGYQASAENMSYILPQKFEEAKQAGIVEGQTSKGYQEAILRAVRAAHKDGIREVVEWIQEHELDMQWTHRVFYEDWQAKLKEWEAKG